MTLARPDIFHPKLVLAGCSRLVTGDGDDAGLVPALRRRGLAARWRAWDDPETLTADLVILRATRDYTERLDEFLAWTRRVPNLLNGPEVVAWNSDRIYLQELAVAGIEVVESEFFGPGQPIHLAAGEVVVKPAVRAGSVGARRFTDHCAARDHAATLQEAGATVLVQPYDARIEQGKTALVFLGGKQSHAFGTGPAEPDFEMWDVGYAALDAAAACLGIAASEFLYARVDLIGGRDDATLLELELVEPALGWLRLDATTRDRQQRQFALAVESALQRLDLGPFSHRRP